jgi:hypothetical protein
MLHGSLRGIKDLHQQYPASEHPQYIHND